MFILKYNQPGKYELVYICQQKLGDFVYLKYINIKY